MELNIKDDIGHKLTDDILSNVERELTLAYEQCYKDTLKKLKSTQAILDEYKDSMTEAQKMALWRRRNRLDNLLNSLSRDIRDTNITAMNMINDSLLNVYDTNYKYGNYFLEQETGYVLDFRLYNQEAIKSLIMDTNTTFNKIALDKMEDSRRVLKDLRRQFTQAIRLGESIDDIARRIRKVINKNNYESVRIARTETTRIESIGRNEAFKKGEDMGLVIKKVWLSTLDSRTRDSHLALNGKSVEMGKRFENGLEHPGDQAGKANEVINCRCAMVAEMQGIKKSAELQQLDEELKGLTFKEWQNRGA